jgi:hypothetical protein
MLNAFGQRRDDDAVVAAPAAGSFQEQKLRCDFEHPMEISFRPVASDEAAHARQPQGAGERHRPYRILRRMHRYLEQRIVQIGAIPRRDRQPRKPEAPMRDRRNLPRRRPVFTQVPMLFAVEPGWQTIEQGFVWKDCADTDRHLEIGNRIHPHGSEKKSCQRLLR